MNRVSELRRASTDITDQQQQIVLPVQGLGQLAFKQLSFRYPGRKAAVFELADLHIPAGSKVALSGPSGIGKSTLVDLLQRHFDPQQGLIELDGVDIRQLALSELRSQLAVVSQDIVLFRASLQDNIRYACPDATDQQVALVAQQARLCSLIDSLPQGIETPLGERGQQLSGGQKQRIAIARALLMQPRILVLDEATAAVDEQTEAQIIAEVDRLFADRTRILISHRQSTLKGAQLRVELDNGQFNILNEQAAPS